MGGDFEPDAKAFKEERNSIEHPKNANVWQFLHCVGKS